MMLCVAWGQAGTVSTAPGVPAGTRLVPSTSGRLLLICGQASCTHMVAVYISLSCEVVLN
jgi:hypothetical protein